MKINNILLFAINYRINSIVNIMLRIKFEVST